MIKAAIRSALGSLGYEITRRQPAPPSAHDVQKLMLGGQSAPVIFDVGAHTGGMSEIYRRLFPEAHIHAFEPTPSAIDILHATFAADGRFHLHPLALSDREGDIAFHLNASGATNSLLAPRNEVPPDWWELMEPRTTVKVPAKAVDGFCAEHDIARIDIMKIDVQGAESLVLKGARDMLARGAIGSVLLEVIVIPSYDGQSRPDEIFSLLCGAGMTLVDLYGVWKRGPALLQFDALFAQPDLARRLFNWT